MNTCRTGSRCALEVLEFEAVSVCKRLPGRHRKALQGKSRKDRVLEEHSDILR